MGCLLATAIEATAADSADSAYPTRPVKIVVPFPQGGGPDLLARVLSQKLSEALGQPFPVDTRAGAAGNIGTELVAKSAPDGYTLLLGADAPFTITPHLYSSLSYDPLNDFAPITLAATTPLYMLANSQFPANSVRELIALAKASPGKYNFASSGNGSQHHLAIELFNTMAGIKLVHVPYKGFGPAVVDVVSGRIELVFGSVPAALPYIKSGKLKVLGITGASRFSGTPDVPTIGESGLPGYDIIAWFGLLVPARTPHSVTAKLHQEIVKALRLKEVADRFSPIGIDIVASTPAEFSARIRADFAKWGKVAKDSGIKLD